MSNYTKATNFATKDTLPTGDSGKIVKGTEIDTEFNSISSAISTKADTASPTLTGTPAAPTATAGTNTTQIATTAFVIAERTTAGTLTNKTLTSPVVTGLTLNDSSIVFEGSSADAFETTLTVTNPTADRTLTLPNSTGTVALTSDLPSDTALYTTSGTYTIAGTTMTISATAHGRAVGDLVYLNFTSGTAVDNYFTIATATTNSFTITYGSSLTTSGNVTGYYSNKGLVSLASSDEAIAGTNTNRAVTPSGVNSAIVSKFNISGSAPVYGVRAWITFSASGGTITTLASANASVTRNGVGDYSLTFTTAMPDANYAVSGSAQWTGSAGLPEIYPFIDSSSNLISPTSSGFRFVVAGSGQYIGLQDSARITVMVIR